MWSVFVVEDELFAREMIREIIDWKELGLRLAGEAGNGEEALEFIQQSKPDIVICDIVMPLMNGVELLRRVRELGLNTRFIMLTCVSEFDEVRQALEYGASSYILKLSMSVKSLKDALNKVTRELRQHAAPGQADIERTYAEGWKILGFSAREDDRTLAPPLASVEEQQLVVIGLFAPAADDPRIVRISEQILERSPSCTIHAYANCGLVSLFCWHDRGEPPAESGEPESGVFRSEAVEPDRWLSAWSHVLAAADHYWYGSKDVRRKAGEISLISDAGRPYWEFERQLIWDFESGRLEQCNRQIGELWMDMRQRRLAMREVKAVASALVSTLCKIARIAPVAMDEIEAASTHEQSAELVRGVMFSCGEKLQADRSGHIEHPQIRLLLQYIEQNYDRDLTVKALARMAAMDETYLSNLFKKKTGSTIIKYIHQVRIERAKELFLRSDLTVSEVGEAVGFGDNNYFNRLFRRYVGMTPGDFRRNPK